MKLVSSQTAQAQFVLQIKIYKALYRKATDLFQLLRLVAKRVETLLTFEANFRHLDNYNICPSHPPVISVVCIGDQIKNLGEQHWKAGGGSKCQWPVSFINQDMFFMK